MNLGSKEDCLDLLEAMLLIRRFEEEAGRQYNRARIGGFLHLGIGEEAAIVGTCRAMIMEDYLFGAYRTHGHALMAGAPTERVMAELFGRKDGVVGGRGGSMHTYWEEGNFLGGYGIVGGHIPLALGYAFSQKDAGGHGATVCVLGDGAANTGNFSECMNMAALWELPILFLVQNNLYGMGTAQDRHSAEAEFFRRGEPYGIKGCREDGMDVFAMRARVEEDLESVREGEPRLLEAMTYRFRGHSAADPEVYRSEEEVASWKERDPIQSLVREMTEAGMLSEEELENLRRKASAEVEEAVQFAESSPEPPEEDLYRGLYHEDGLYGEGVPWQK